MQKTEVLSVGVQANDRRPRGLLLMLAGLTVFGTAFGLAYMVSGTPARPTQLHPLKPWKGGPIRVRGTLNRPRVKTSFGAAAALPRLRVAPTTSRPSAVKSSTTANPTPHKPAPPEVITVSN